MNNLPDLEKETEKLIEYQLKMVGGTFLVISNQEFNSLQNIIFTKENIDNFLPVNDIYKGKHYINIDYIEGFYEITELKEDE